MGILSGFIKTKKYRKTDSGYKLQSEWTSSQSVEMNDGNTLEKNLGSIKGITSSLTSTNGNYALSAYGGNLLQNKIEGHKDEGATSSEYGHVKLTDSYTVYTESKPPIAIALSDKGAFNLYHDLNSKKQDASTAITTSNIASQSVASLRTTSGDDSKVSVNWEDNILRFIVNGYNTTNLPWASIGSSCKPIYWNAGNIAECGFRIYGGTIVKQVSGTGSFCAMTAQEAGALVGVSSADNTNSILLASNGDYNSWSTTFEGTFYYNNAWYIKVSTENAFTDAYCRINYLLVYFG